MGGKFIVFEGVEGCGKTTQMQHVYQWLQERFPKGVVQTREPGGTELGLQLREVLLDRHLRQPIRHRAELLLYGADRAQHIEEFIKPHLDRGHIVLCDRYTDSTVAYQGYGRGLDRDTIAQINALATQGLTGDLTLWLDVEVEIGLERARRRGKINRLDAESIAFHQRVRQGYAELAQTAPHRIVRVDSSATEVEVAANIRAVVEEWLAKWYQGKR